MKVNVKREYISPNIMTKDMFMPNYVICSSYYVSGSGETPDPDGNEGGGEGGWGEGGNPPDGLFEAKMRYSELPDYLDTNY